MATNLPRCMKLAEICYNNPDPALCQVAEEICWEGVVEWYDGESYAGGRNRFDITIPCVLDDFCYKQVADIQKYLNRKQIWKALDVPEALPGYNVSSEEVAIAFSLAGDEGLTTEPQVVYLLSKGIDTLIYQGNLDLACNTAGNLKWFSDVPWKGQPEFNAKPLTPWYSDGKAAGKFKEVRIQMPGNDKKTRLTFLTVDDAGHMVRCTRTGCSFSTQ